MTKLVNNESQLFDAFEGLGAVPFHFCTTTVQIHLLFGEEHYDTN